MEAETGAVPKDTNHADKSGRRDEPLPSEKDPERGNVLRSALTSVSFVEKAALLLLTTTLSGILVPMLISYFNAKATESQKAIEAMKARDTAILQAQSKLLDDVSETVLTYETLALDVSWYMTRAGRDKDLHQKAVARYSERTVDIISKWRVFISRSRTLASPAVSEKLEAFLARVFLEQDAPMTRLNGANATVDQWEEQHRKNEAMLVDANGLITDITNDLGLSKSNLHH